MKVRLLIASCLMSLAGLGQVYTPSGNIQGSSSTNSVGIGTSSPSAKLDIATNSAIGALGLQTTNAEGLGGIYTPSPFAISLNYTDNSGPMPFTSEVFNVAADGKLTIGNAIAFATSSSLRVFHNFELAFSNTEYLQLGYKLNGPNHRIPTFSFDNAGAENAIVDWGFGTNVATSQNKMRLHEDGSLYLGNIGSGRGFASFSADYINDASLAGANTGLYVRSSGNHQANFALEISNGTGAALMTVTNVGVVSIGTTVQIADPTYSLYVANGVRTEKVRVDVQGNWPDYVFEDSYEYMSFLELSKYISIYGRLPYLPSASEVESDGYDMAQADQGILRNLEEATLRSIDSEKRLSDANQRIKELEDRLEQLESLVSILAEKTE